MVKDDVAGLFEPEGAYLVEDLALERNIGEDSVEGALPVGGDQKQFLAEVIGVADLAFFTVW